MANAEGQVPRSGGLAPRVSSCERLIMLPCVLIAALCADVPPPPSECRTNSECAITTAAGCCGECCQSTPFATTAERVRATRAQCARLECISKPCGGGESCPAVDPVSAFVAVCSAGRCVAERRPTPRPAAECRRDEECVVASTAAPPGDACHASPCGCCPMTWVGPAERQRVPLTKRDGQRPPPFGLSTGPRPAQCAPCPSVPSRAACIAGRCVVAPRPQPPG